MPDNVWDKAALRPLLDVLPPDTDLILTTRNAGVLVKNHKMTVQLPIYGEEFAEKRKK